MDNFKLFFGFVLYDTLDQYNYTKFIRYNGEPFFAEQTLINVISTGRHDLVIANDGLLQKDKSSAGSIAVIYSKDGPKDSLIFTSSNDGGMTFNNRRQIFATSKHITKLDLCYGSSPQWNEGRYYAVWDEKEGSGSNTGHIYTAHSESGINSPFTQAVCLDSLESSDINHCSNPVISCQYGNIDNDSANITSVILYEKYNTSNQKTDVKGYYNRQSANSDYFNPFSFTNPNNDNFQPDLVYNPHDSAFIATWYDATSKKLPCLNNGFNLSQPYSWNILSAGYNDQENISNPNPKICINEAEKKAANVWISDGPGGNGVGLFDAQYSTYTGINETSLMSNSLILKVYPNPCASTVTIELETRTIENIDITLFDFPGRPVRKFCNQKFTDGKHKLGADLSDLPAGSYSCIMRIGNMIVASKIVTIQR